MGCEEEIQCVASVNMMVRNVCREVDELCEVVTYTKVESYLSSCVCGA